jgi:hypothetical protein
MFYVYSKLSLYQASTMATREREREIEIEIEIERETLEAYLAS